METMELTIEEQKRLDAIIKAGDFCGRYKGNDNYRKPKIEYLKKLVKMTDEQLLKECESKIWLSAYANNNPRSDYHWHADACYDECKNRDKPDIYKRAYKKIERSI